MSTKIIFDFLTNLTKYLKEVKERKIKERIRLGEENTKEWNELQRTKIRGRWNYLDLKKKAEQSGE